MKTKKPIVFWLFYHLGMLLFSVIASMVIKYNQTGKAFVPETILSAAIIFTISVVIGYLAIYFTNRGARLSPKELRKQIVPGFLVFLVGTLVIANLSVSLGVLAWYIIKGIDMHNFLHNLLKYELSYANKSLFIWLLFFSIAFFYILWRKSSQKEDKLREENLKYKYRTLKSQVNPHFLFNSLNTLSELIYSDVKKADSYIQKLSGVYRYVLENEENELVPLENELIFIREYFDLQKVRDNDKVLLKIDIENLHDYQIIPVSLQLLVENALKHNSRSREKPLQIKISYINDHIVVSNNIQKKNIMENTTQRGLLNLSERVKLIMNKDLIITEVYEEFIVKIPIIRREA